MDENYKDRYCAFVDVLGFREMVSNLDREQLTLSEMRDLLSFVHGPIGMNTDLWPTGFRAQSISDAVAISTNASSAGLYEMLRAIEGLTLQLLDRGYFIRGGLVKGRLYHDDHMVFGRALMEAYRLESEVARYPRIMVTREVWLDFEKYKAEQQKPINFDNWVIQADDGPMFVNSLRSTAQFACRTKLENVNLSPPEQKNLDHITHLEDLIQKRLDMSIDNLRHFEKVRWFAEFWNRSVPYGGSDFSTIQGPGLN